MQEFLIEKGIVESFDETTVKIVVVPSNDCVDCSAKLFCKTTSESKNILSVSSSDKFQIGDSVKVVVKGKNVFLFTFFLYGLPLIILITSILLGLYILVNIKNSELYSFTFSIILLIIYYLLLNKFIKHYKSYFDSPTLIKIDSSN